jgi:glycosyltransferase involved in cell wall biosynthesis
MSGPLISVIIPCYNQGHFLKDALKSLDNCEQGLFETIIVNDGSTDEYTNEYLRELSEAGRHVIFQSNTGLGGARNAGIRAARGSYIIPLDADNRIYPAYLTKSVEILAADEKVAVVYGNGNYFGGKSGEFKPGPFNLQRIMLGNYIDACAVIRKTAIEEVGYYENMRIMGLEDWDLWLRIAFKGYGFHYVDEVLFDYRVSPGSMIATLNSNIERQNAIEEYFREKYHDKLDFEFVRNYFVGKMKRAPLQFFYRLVLRKYFPEYYQKRIKQGKMYNGWLYDGV